MEAHNPLWDKEKMINAGMEIIKLRDALQEIVELRGKLDWSTNSFNQGAYAAFKMAADIAEEALK